jgi:competence protein ComEA
MTLPRIGPALADRILAHRAQFGPFLSVDDLLMIRGIGPATLERLRPLLYVPSVPRDTARVIHDYD